MDGYTDEIQQQNTELKEQGSLLDAVEQKGDKLSNTGKDVVGSKEISSLEALRQKLVEVKEAVDAKTRAFEEEYVTVDAAVESEMVQLNALLDLLNQITAQIGIFNESFSNTGNNVISSGGTVTVTHLNLGLLLPTKYSALR